MKPWDIFAREFVDKWLQADSERTLRISNDTLVLSDGHGPLAMESTYWDLACELGWPSDPEQRYMELMKRLDLGRALKISEAEEDDLLDQMDEEWWKLTEIQQKKIGDFFVKIHL